MSLGNNVVKEILLNQLIRVPTVRKIARRRHQTGMSHYPELLDRNYSLLTSFSAVRGKSILELGPGKSVGIIEKAKRDGATVVTIADVEPYLNEKEVEELGIEYCLYDGKTFPLKTEAFDLIWSNAVLEHIRHPEAVVRETFRLLRPGGLVIHLIDLLDHFGHGKNVPEQNFNCLKYPEWLWRAMTWNRSNYVNRLRTSDWLRLHEKTGFEIMWQHTETCDFTRENYQRLPKLSYLKKYSETDAATTALQVVARKQ